MKAAEEGNRYKEFIAFTALLTSAVALSIDMLLPAFSDLRLDFSLAEDSNLPALTITCLFIGMAIGTPIYGPLADTFGRIRILQIGIFLFAIGAIGSTFAPNFSFLLISRVIWGFGCAAPRSLAQAMVRDRFEGDEMARVMGIIQTVFFAGPVLAPLIGHLLLQIGSWRLTMAFGLATAIAMWVWSFRIPESLTENKKRALTFKSIKTGVKAVCRNRTTVGYSLTLMFAAGAFYSFLSSSELIVTQVLARPGWFVPYFSVTMVVMAIVALLGSKLVGRIGARSMARRALIAQFVFSSISLIVALSTSGVPPAILWMFLTSAQIASMVLMMPTMTTLSLEPMGDLAGTATSIIGFLSLAGGALLGASIDRQITSTVTPLSAGYVLFTGIGLLVLTFVVPKAPQKLCT